LASWYKAANSSPNKTPALYFFISYMSLFYMILFVDIVVKKNANIVNLPVLGLILPKKPVSLRIFL
jgi:hypothetical protein